MPGAIAYGLHEGSRSEYLAQFAFSAFGTAVAIPHQEDAGIDLFCHFVERVGRHAWSRFPYTVQVKSTMEPWVFDGEEAIRWLVEYPLPLFLCVVDKCDGRLRTYHTGPRFYHWALGEHTDRVTMTPEMTTEGRFVQWPGSFDFSLTAPILDFHVTDILKDEFRAAASEVLAFWADVEFENLRRLKSGIRRFKMPDGYQPNSTRIKGWGTMGRTIGSEEHTEQGLEHSKEVIDWLGQQLYNRGDVAGAVRAALLFRHLFRDEHSHYFVFLLSKLKQQMGFAEGEYLYAAIDKIGECLDELAQCDERGQPKDAGTETGGSCPLDKPG